MGACLNSCCASEAGLRCHSVITLCGFGYFLFMFLIFPKQQLYFEFEIPDPEGTRWACLFTALLFLLFFFIVMINLLKVDQNKKGANVKKKVSLSEFKQEKYSLKEEDREMAKLIEE